MEIHLFGYLINIYYLPVFLLLFPITWINKFWYENIWGVYQMGSFDMITRYWPLMSHWSDCIYTFLASGSGAYYFLLDEYAMSPLLHISIFCLGFFLISVIGDSLIQTYITQKNTRYHREKSNKQWIWIYSLYRILLPDFFIVGALITYFTGMQMPRRDIWKMNIYVQLLRVCIGAVLFYLIWHT